MKNDYSSGVEIKESVSSSLGWIAILVSVIAYLFLDKQKFTARIDPSVYWLILVSLFFFLAYKVLILARRKVVMRVSNEGVYHNDFGLMKWDDILSIKRARKSGGDHYTIFFLFQTNRSSEPYKVVISGLDCSEEALIKLIRGFRDYNIYEVVYDEW